MKIKIKLSTLILVSFLFSSFLQAQVPVSTPANDQIIQGPCYIFATVAALESKAIESGYSSSLDFYEWNLYSKAVVGSLSGNGYTMFEEVISHASTSGVYENGAGTVPINESQLPNMGDPLVPGMADFQAPCAPTFTNTFYELTPEGNCDDIDTGSSKSFSIISFSGPSFVYNTNGGTGYVFDDTPTETEVRNLLNNNIGVVALFRNWRAGNSHSIFIYGIAGSSYRYKDSWPGDAGNKTGPLDFSRCTDFYYLTGSFSPPPTCQGNIVGPGTVSGSSTFDLTGGPYTNVKWNVSSGLVLDNHNSPTSIDVSPANCGNTTANIEVTYTENGIDCITDIDVSVENTAVAPTDILVMSPNWNNGETCPGTLLPLEVSPIIPGTTYEWQIFGATPQGPTNTPYLNVLTPNVPETVYLTFRVRVISTDCPPSAWKTKYGTSSPSNCGGGTGNEGGPKIVGGTNHQLTFDNLYHPSGEKNDLRYQVISINGQILQTGSISAWDSSIDISAIRGHLIFVHLFDEQSDFQQTFKYVIPR